MSGSVSDLSSISGQNGAAQSRLPNENAVFRFLFPGGLIPVERMDSLPAMRSHISALLALASGQARARKSISAEKSQAVNLQIARLKETPKDDGTTRTWREIAQIIDVGIKGDSCHKRYRSWKLQQERFAVMRSAADAPLGMTAQAETLRNVPQASSEVQQKTETAPGRLELQEARPAQSADAQDLEPKASQNSKKVLPAAAARAPKIPHSEDEFILTERAGGKKFREIHEALQARGIKCKLDDVITRHYSLLKKGHDSPKAESKATELQHHAEPAPALAPIQAAHPGVSPEDLKWILDLAEKDWSAEEISQELTQNGVPLGSDEIARILSQRQNVKDPQPTEISQSRLTAQGAKL